MSSIRRAAIPWRAGAGAAMIMTMIMVTLIAGAAGGPAPVRAAPADQPAAPAAAACSDLPADECGALNELYTATGGPSWRSRAGWLANNAACTWQGVVCRNGHVAELWLQDNGLVGPLPPLLTKLPYLEALDLQKNQLTGALTLPDAGLPSLRLLHLGNNQLSGGLPPGLFASTGLTHLILWANQLGGDLPTGLCSLTRLKVLGLSDNTFSGPLPGCLGSLAQLEELVLSSNGLYGPIPGELGRLAQLRILSLGRNLLSGSIPASLTDLTALRTLYLGGNNLSGPLPADIGKLANLESLVLWESGLEGPLPAGIGSLTKLREVYLNHNRLSGAIPATVGNLTQVITLTLNNNLLTGSLPAELGQLGQLRSLHLDANKLSGGLPATLGALDNLVELYAAENDFYGPLPAELGDLPQIKVLHLGGNQLQGSLPAAWAKLASLRQLYLYDNQLSGSIPAWIGQLGRLEVLNLARNRLTGSLPPELGKLAQLRELQADFNDLSGELPAELGKLGKLQILTLWVNRISGPIPPELGSMAALRLLGLSENQLSGPIPPELGKLALLEQLHLHTNRLSGKIPAALGGLSHLQTLLIDKNALSGEIPAALAGLTEANLVRVYYNMLTARDGALRAWLDRLSPGWAATQTLPPQGVQVAVQGTKLAVTWEPIAYQEHGGGYWVEYGVARGGPYTGRLYVRGKQSAAATLEGLLGGQTYYIVVRSVTPKHMGENQQNELRSAYAPEVRATLPASNRGDAFEPDDACTAAQPAAADGSTAQHSLHRAGDEDWVVLTVQRGVTYRVEAQPLPSSPADLVIELYDSCSGAPTFRSGEETVKLARVEFTAPANGSVYVRFTDDDPALGGDHVRYSATLRSLAAQGEPGAFIIVAGRLSANDALQFNIANITRQVYDYAAANGYSDDRILYLAPTYGSDERVDGRPTLANLQQGVTEWAAERLGPGRAFTLFLMDHGNRGIFYLDEPNGQRLTPRLLDSWLRRLEQARPDTLVNVIIEACYGGSFITYESGVSGEGRLVITSTTDDHTAYASERGAIFSDFFWTQAAQGYSVLQSFQAASSAAQGEHMLQVPWLDGNGNGVVNEADDAAVAAQRGFGKPGTLAPLWAPTVLDLHLAAPGEDGRGAIQASVIDDTPAPYLPTVTASIYPPGYTPPDADDQLLPGAPYTVTLTPAADGAADGVAAGAEPILYSGLFDHFDQQGRYLVILHAVDKDGLSASPLAGEVAVGGSLYLPLLSR